MSTTNNNNNTTTTTTTSSDSGDNCCFVEEKPKQQPKQQQHKQKPKQQQTKEKQPISKQGGGKSEFNFVNPAVVNMPQDAKYVDSHVHIDQILIREKLTLEDFTSFQKAKFPPQFERCVQVCCDPVSLDYTDFLVKFDPIYAAYGVHPHNASQYNDDIENKLVERMKHPKTVAWGEMGLDYFYTKSPRDKQMSAFASQLKKAVECKKPLVIHSREAEQDTLDLLTIHVPKDWKIHIHCFTSNPDFAQKLLAHFSNLYIGFTGCITFKNSESIRASVQAVPIERMLLETDGPYMTPEPFRGQTAHSGHIPQVANMIAQVKQLSLEQVLKQCRINTTNVYGI
ncbi:hypothetical protein DLAC_10341 [Tieghemostelium lacteum]|uniref:Uncharacterized protein n=1 Tax=Tieghemostelium lacteum TaxID=361077 RepID=A0A151Z555_TIELA|nr:hypothetical protein DLAC_10341 [Tieghemostelium lacteum]|eukprot:KYQ89109.1 hypothetical protein DLAC_10341 [Tieghemostelium lacteum]